MQFTFWEIREAKTGRTFFWTHDDSVSFPAEAVEDAVAARGLTDEDCEVRRRSNNVWTPWESLAE